MFEGPASVITDTGAALSWDSTNASGCTASGGWQGSRDLSGSEITEGLTELTSFVLTCTGAGGSVAQTVTVQVTQPPADSDSDGLLDTWEQQYFGNLDQTSSGDPDGDSLTNMEEANAQTDPTKADTDDDGLSDSEEATHSTNPLVSDSDGDGSSDFAEVQAGSDPNDSSSLPPVVTPPVEPPVENNSGSGSGSSSPLVLLTLVVFALRRRFI